ncbi:UTP--glucose-1-phosphate uridylyltransferase [Candidatus Heimdallarchaeota archaeon]|nr:MAG: UTP--glucose-1-phosphate uridylyltransferase [Candidatus Heimdallarchaeota archaeon]RLI69482.1 MAG: UTP--glucose-1-phosphate uridylyltransferase [Candidatus Gerdarchaeota archaeon]RLI69512.1 MAG: UTP--glucose-1-phosphate uridylyltransferase [Candidatus Gerdarchaeota archaeon]
MKGVIPAAGLGTRMLPATKSQPKEMLPVAKKPVIQYIVEEMEAAGIKDILIITGKNKRAIEDHFDRDPILLEDLKKKNKVNQLHDLEALENLNVQIFYVRQAIPTGLADAVYKAKEFVGNDDFVVALGDTIIDSSQSPIHLARLIDFHRKAKAVCALSVEEIPLEHCNRYGILAVSPFLEEQKSTQTKGKYLVKDLIEKPSPKEAPSNLAICGRYVFSPVIFDYIKQVKVGKGGEKQLTDAMHLLRKEGRIVALQLAESEKRFDTGSFPLYAKAFVSFCLRDKEIGEELRAFLKNLEL